MGKVVFSRATAGKVNSFELTDLHEGIYILDIMSATNERFRMKILKINCL